MKEKNYCVILAGGLGTRLWPMSREKMPKQFIDVLGTGQTLLQSTYYRFARFIDEENILIVTNEKYRSLVKEQIPGIDESNVLVEPMRRNTVPAVTWAALEVKRRCPDGCLVVSPSDQNISGDEAFEEDVLRGLSYVGENEVLLTMGAKPSRPETSYGYIQMASLVHGTQDIYKVQSFTEKPAEEFAKIFYESGEFLWNTGLFMWSADAFLKAVTTVNDDMKTIIGSVVHGFRNGENVSELLLELFAKCPNMTLEQNVLEKSDNVDVMLCHFGWADLGTWTAVHDALPQSDTGNVVIDSKSLLYDCKNCLIKLPDGHVAVVQGLEGYVIVEDGNVLVVCKKDDQKNIRKFVNDAQLNLGEEYV